MAHFAKVNNGIVEQVIVAEPEFFERKNYAGIGYSYDATRDAFIPPKPYASWVLNETTCLWESPVAYPTDGNMYRWDEATTAWIQVEERA